MPSAKIHQEVDATTVTAEIVRQFNEMVRDMRMMAEVVEDVKTEQAALKANYHYIIRKLKERLEN